MSRAISEGAGKRYGLERVCRVLDFPRSTIYEQQAQARLSYLLPAAFRQQYLQQRTTA